MEELKELSEMNFPEFCFIAFSIGFGLALGDVIVKFFF